MYIPEFAVRQTLRFVRDHSGPGSTIVFNYLLRGMPAINNSNPRYARWGEPMIFGFPGNSAADFVRSEGLEVVSDLSLRQAPRRSAQQTDEASAAPARPRAENKVRQLPAARRCKAAARRPTPSTGTIRALWSAGNPDRCCLRTQVSTSIAPLALIGRI